MTVNASGAEFIGVLSRTEERDMQFATQNRARQAAKLETNRTGRKHQAFLTTCYRVQPDNNIIALACWTVCLALRWRAGNLVTA